MLGITLVVRLGSIARFRRGEKLLEQINGIALLFPLKS
jgi:hypothetical protein